MYRVELNKVQHNTFFIIFDHMCSANGSRDSSVSIVTRLQKGQPRDLRYQAETGGFSIVHSKKISTEAHKAFFTKGPADTRARVRSCPPSMT